MCDAGQYSCDGLSCHDALSVSRFPESRHVRENAVLTKACGQTCREDHDHQEGEVPSCTDIEKRLGEKRKQGEDDHVDYQRADNTFRVRGIRLQPGKDEHGSEVRDGGDGDLCCLEIVEDPVVTAEALLEVWAGG